MFKELNVSAKIKGVCMNEAACVGMKVPVVCSEPSESCFMVDVIAVFMVWLVKASFAPRSECARRRFRQFNA